MVVDAGPDTVRAIAADCRGAGTIIWNGPLGIYEIPAFASGTREVARAVAASKATSVIGGGDLAAAVEDAGVADKIGFISTGGGATIEFLEGRTLPGVAALRDREAARR
jgi:phosphoglycerate kinase